MTKNFDDTLDDKQRILVSTLTTPVKIQAFLDSVAYSAEDANRCPVTVLRDRQAHCLDGGLFAAAALRRLGHPPFLVDLLPDPGTDDDHVLAIFRENGCFGAVAKSNFVGLRYREPVYRSLRELVMSYFADFFNIDGLKTLRAYSVPLNLEDYDYLDWMGSDARLDVIERRLAGLRHFPLISEAMAACLEPVDPLSFKAGTLVVNRAGLYKPKA
ncbi:MAG TPA: hypothetical protein VF498_16055 [Anaerolineales bacterium]